MQCKEVHQQQVVKDLQVATDKTYDPEGTGLGRVLDRLSGTGQLEQVVQRHYYNQKDLQLSRVFTGN